MSENMDVIYTRGDNTFTKFEVPTTFRSRLVGPNGTDEQTDGQHIYCVTARLEGGLHNKAKACCVGDVEVYHRGTRI